MVNLYAAFHGRSSYYNKMKIFIARFFAAFVLLSLTACNKKNSGITIDSEVPGTEVYLYGQKLGTVPLNLSSDQLQKLGLPDPSIDTNAVLDSDGWGEGLIIRRIREQDNVRLLLHAPHEARADYLSIETPWGTRSKGGGGSIPAPNTFRSHLMPVTNAEGLALSIEIPPFVSRNQTNAWTVTATLTNSGSVTITGYRPQLRVLYGTFQTHWQRRIHKTVSLPSEWASITPGAMLEYKVQLDNPILSEDYSVFVVYSLHTDPNSASLVGSGSVYSESQLLRVR